MQRLTRSTICILAQLFLIALLTKSAEAFVLETKKNDGILHLEIGAANYEAKKGNAKERFWVLDHELEKLVAEYGPRGKVYLNDIQTDGLKLAVAHAKKWLKQRGYTEITVLELPGDYTKIKVPFVKSASMNHPGWEQLADPLQQTKIVQSLRRLARYSETGLKINTYFYDAKNPAMQTLIKSLPRTIQLEDTKTFGHEYHKPDGSTLNATHGRPKIYRLTVSNPQDCYLSIVSTLINSEPTRK